LLCSGASCTRKRLYETNIRCVQDIFSREHNAVADAVSAEEPNLDDEGIFRKARLVVSAVVAKVHTIDWTVEVCPC
jgi:alpha-dioxygenase